MIPEQLLGGSVLRLKSPLKISIIAIQILKVTAENHTFGSLKTKIKFLEQ